MKNIIIAIIILLFLAVVGYVLYSKNFGRVFDAGNGNMKSGQTQNQNPPMQFNFVKIQNFEFLPTEIRVDKGATVTWMNMDSALHQIKSATFNSPQLDMGQSFSFRFDDAGIFEYSCAIHPSMTGRIIVQ